MDFLEKAKNMEQEIMELRRENQELKSNGVTASAELDRIVNVMSSDLDKLKTEVHELGKVSNNDAKKIEAYIQERGLFLYQKDYEGSTAKRIITSILRGYIYHTNNVNRTEDIRAYNFGKVKLEIEKWTIHTEYNKELDKKLEPFLQNKNDLFVIEDVEFNE